jgi:hypothetical protein
VHAFDDESAIAGSLQPSIDLVVVRNGSSPLSSEQQTVRIVVMGNTVPTMEVS